jgi:hypothetical protein
LITVNGLEVGAIWQYSVNGGNSFVNGTGSSFMLANNTAYVANAIQIKQTDAVGNVSAKPLTVIKPLLVMPSLSDRPVSTRVNAG